MKSRKPLSSRRSDAAFLLLLLPLLVYVSFSPALSPSAEFVFDDLPALVDNPDVRTTHTNLTSIFTHDFWGERVDSAASHKSYRPLTVLLFRAIRAGAGGDDAASPRAFRACGLLLHYLNAVLVYLLSPSSLSAWSSALFAVHPLRSEPVCTAVGLADLLCALCILLALVAHKLGRAPAAAEVLAVCALGSAAVLVKETGVMLAPMVLAAEILAAVRDRARGMPLRRLCLKGAAYSVHAAAVLYLRLRVMGFEGPRFQPQDNPAAVLPLLHQRAANRLYQYALNTWLMVAPDWLCFDWAMGCVRLLETGDIRLTAVTVFVALVGWAGIRALVALLDGGSADLALALAIFALPFLPSANVFFNVGFVVAERNLYLPLLGYQLVLLEGVRRLSRRLGSRSWIRLGLLLVLATHVAKSRQRASDWTNEPQLFSAGLRVCPDNAKVHYNLAKRAADAGRADRAVEGYKRAIELHPDYEQALNNLGNLYRKQGKFSESKSLLRRAVEIKENFAAAWMNLGTVQTALGEHSEAESSYRRALEHRTPYPDCWYNLGNLFLKTRRPREALAVFQRCLDENPAHRRAWANLVILADDLGDLDLAERSALSALAAFPDAAEFHAHLAAVHGKRGEFELAEARYLRSLALQETSFVYGNLGVLYHRWKRPREAREAYEKALILDPDNHSARNNMDSLAPKKQQQQQEETAQ